MSSSNKRPPPTKLELIKLKRSLVVAKSVYKILEDKRDVLLKVSHFEAGTPQQVFR